jgi:hypothetical protein
MRFKKRKLTVRVKIAEGVTAAPKSVDDIVDGTNALKRWVLTGGWRNAVYYYEPSFGAERSLIRKYCDALERIA